MANYESPIALGKALAKASNHTPYYFNESFDTFLSGYKWGDKEYDNERKQAFDFLTSQNGLTPNQANDVLDAYITKATHNYGKGLERKVGKFETGQDWEQAQNTAKDLIAKNPDAFGVLYSLTYGSETPRGTSGLKNPLLVYDDKELKDITRSLEMGKEKNKFTLGTLFNENRRAK